MTTPRKPGVDAHDVVALLGIAMLFGGLWWVFPPAALVVVGALFIAAAVRGTTPRGGR